MTDQTERIATMSGPERRTLRENCQRALSEPAREEAARRMLASLDEVEASERRAETERLAAMSDEDRIVEAFRRVPPTDTEAALVRALLENPGSSSGELTKAMGWAGDSAWHLHFGTACQKRAHHLWPAPSAEHRKDLDGKPASFWSGILANYEEGTGFTMKPEAARAFARLGIAPRER